ncbi:uncharacterized protein LOC113356663 [Papaver somniferum]|uniref:uncharacterized protein LOC113356663 n=1 Tax=Papaver somniferum TaxID=3469 RepID=UPI000E6FD4F4|nr:uncharacterized protein LOC113356663 [Papaver somniferum]
MGVTYFPDRYLGVKVMPGVVKYSHISNVVDKLKDQLSVYKGKMLSFQDRVVLVKTVLSSYAIHNMVVYKWPVKFVKQCERVIRNLLWSGDSNLARYFVVGYDKICSPVREGVLGLTSLSNMNKALIMNLWWSIKASTKKWARFLDSKFTCRDALADVLQRTDLDRNARVNDIIMQDQWQLEGVHMHDLVSAGVVLESLPRRHTGSDRKIWMPELKGLFSVKSARELVRTRYPVLEEANLLWKNVVHPYLAAQNWKFARGACATLDKVKSRFKIALPSRCSVCQIEEESLEHVLWSCSASKHAWQWLADIFHIIPHYNLLAANKEAKGRSRMVKDLWLVSILVLLSELWYQRNKMVYEKKKPCWTFFKKRVFNLIHEYSARMTGCMFNKVEDLEILNFFRVECRRVKMLEHVECFWQPHMQNQLLLCCDGASRGNPGVAGASVEARNSACEVVGAMCVGLGIISNYMAESYSILIGLEWAVQWGYRDVLVQTDSSSFITALEGDSIPWFARQRWRDVKGMFDSINFVHTYREANFATDKMAKTDEEDSDLDVAIMAAEFKKSKEWGTIHDGKKIKKNRASLRGNSSTNSVEGAVEDEKKKVFLTD